MCEIVAKALKNGVALVEGVAGRWPSPRSRVCDRQMALEGGAGRCLLPSPRSIVRRRKAPRPPPSPSPPSPLPSPPHPSPSAMLAAWDRQILTNRHSLLEVEGELKGVSAGQEALERKLFLPETHQKVSRGADGLKGVSARQENLELRTPPLSPCPLSPPHLTSMRPAPRPSPLSGDPRRAGPLPPPLSGDPRRAGQHRGRGGAHLWARARAARPGRTRARPPVRARRSH